MDLFYLHRNSTALPPFSMFSDGCRKNSRWIQTIGKVLLFHLPFLQQFPFSWGLFIVREERVRASRISTNNFFHIEKVKKKSHRKKCNPDVERKKSEWKKRTQNAVSSHVHSYSIFICALRWSSANIVLVWCWSGFNCGFSFEFWGSFYNSRGMEFEWMKFKWK